MASHQLPVEFVERLQKIVPPEQFATVLFSFSQPDPIVIRVNALKPDAVSVAGQLTAEGLALQEISWCPGAYIAAGWPKEKLSAHPLVINGQVYFQNISSLIPALVLKPVPGDRILDLCAAPGSKTTQMSGLMNNQGEITAVEAVRPRFFRLHSVCGLLGAKNVKLVLTDGRRFRAHQLFDKILVDAPCSSEGRFKAGDPESFGYWSTRKIKEMSQKQKGLLMNAGRLVKPGGDLVYSTCTLAPEEN
ncbi:MAG: RsmB/NOP family class I SAM-dependent RNA methyltransferase, partial [Candidatus Omnitrophica bacterium]|nr:RsmB/NOP family class I SAM-dependent RNA methyltransferase [Candidatus Omnitrophota bacterium]